MAARFLVDAPGPTPFVEQQIPMAQYPNLFQGRTSLVGSMETRAYATGPSILVDVFRSDSAFSPRQEGDALFSVAGYTTRP